MVFQSSSVNISLGEVFLSTASPYTAAMLEVSTILFTDGVLVAVCKTFLVPSKAGSINSFCGSFTLNSWNGEALCMEIRGNSGRPSIIQYRFNQRFVFLTIRGQVDSKTTY